MSGERCDVCGAAGRRLYWWGESTPTPKKACRPCVEANDRLHGWHERWWHYPEDRPADTDVRQGGLFQ